MGLFPETFHGNIIWRILEIFQVGNFAGIYVNSFEIEKCIETVSYTNIDINLLFALKMTCMQMYRMRGVTPLCEEGCWARVVFRQFF